MENKYYIIGNWKMFPVSMPQAKKLAKDCQSKVVVSKFIEVVICPPSIFLASLVKDVKGKIKYGIQGPHHEDSGAFTSSVSSVMAASVGAKYALIGHSEERKAGLTDEMAGASLRQALKYDLRPIVCVGEKERDPNGFYLHEVKSQLEVALSYIPKVRYKDVIVAYEPVWAIGDSAKRVATDNEFIEMKIFIQKIISDLTNRKTADEVAIIYGGSADDTNMHSFLQAGARGFLAGRASHDSVVFAKMIDQVIEYAKNAKR